MKPIVRRSPTEEGRHVVALDGAGLNFPGAELPCRCWSMSYRRLWAALL
jgi:hypothetical protein